MTEEPVSLRRSGALDLDFATAGSAVVRTKSRQAKPQPRVLGAAVLRASCEVQGQLRRPQIAGAEVNLVLRHGYGFSSVKSFKAARRSGPHLSPVAPPAIDR